MGASLIRCTVSFLSKTGVNWDGMGGINCLDNRLESGTVLL